MDWDDEAAFEPLGEFEQALLDRLHLVVEPQGCRWIDDADQHCSQPLARLRSRSPYCEEHLRRSLTEAGWRRLLATAGRESELQTD